MTQQHNINGLGIAARNRQVFLFCTVSSARKAGGFRIAASKDGRTFALSPKLPTMTGGRKGPAPAYADFRVARFGREYFLAYKNASRSKLMLAALSEDLWKWHDLGTLAGIHETATLVSDHSVDGEYVLYFGEKKTIHLEHSKNMKRWTAIDPDAS